MNLVLNGESVNIELGRHWFVVNISEPSEQAGVILLNKDPRKKRIKPDVYVGVVEEVGYGCTVQPGDQVVLERFVYSQPDIDEERIFAAEADILMLNGKTIPGIISVMLIEDVPKTKLALPVNYRPENKPYHFGMVIESGVEGIERETLVWLERRDNDQFLNGKQLVCRIVDERVILMTAKLDPVTKEELWKSREPVSVAR